MWLSLQDAADYTSFSIRSLRRCIGDPSRPLPVYYVHGKILCNSDELDRWIRGFPSGGNEVAQLVDEILRDVKQHTRKR